MAETELTAAQLAELESQYKPFPSFEEFSGSLDVSAGIDELRRVVARFEEVRERVADDDQAVGRIRTEMMRAAAWDTGAIEDLYRTDRGITLTVAQQAATWEAAAAEQGENALALFEAQLDAYEMVLDLVTERRPVTESLIRQLHETVTAPQETYRVVTPVGPQEQALPKGEWKPYPNHVKLADGSIHVYAPVDQTSAEMRRLVDELRCDPFADAEPVVQAAYLHYTFVSVHPFADGNGRVARALASVFTYRGYGVPFYVFADQKKVYFDGLEAADQGDHQPFHEFVLRWTIRAVGVMADQLSAATLESPEQASDALRQLLEARGGLGHAQLEELARTVAREINNQLGALTADVALPRGVEVQPLGGSGRPREPGPYRGTQGGDSFHLQGLILRATVPETEMDTRRFIGVARSRDASYDIAVIDDAGDVDLGLWVDELHPEPTTAFTHRLDAWARRFLAESLDAFQARVDAALREGGYR